MTQKSESADSPVFGSKKGFEVCDLACLLYVEVLKTSGREHLWCSGDTDAFHVFVQVQ